jgi:probable DNA metabolism protein
METLAFDGTFSGWQTVARDALHRSLPPPAITWRDLSAVQTDFSFGEQLDLLGQPATPNRVSASSSSPSQLIAKSLRVPRAFMDIARTVACHRDPTRWSLLYRTLWRITHDEPQLFANTIDPDVLALGEMSKAIRRDIHKMRAFVRFREIPTEHGPWFVAWFEPHHHIVEANAKFFVDRFHAMNWSILTPEKCMHWDRHQLAFTPGVTRDQAPTEDATEDLWLTYYANIFNPARVKTNAMKKEMPIYYWKNLPEAAIIGDLLADAPRRVEAMAALSQSKPVPTQSFTGAPIPITDDLHILRDAAATCRACPLWQNATCAVFGEGPPHARMVVVGEQPGDQEDLSGHPFVGPAGKLFDRALHEAGINRAELWKPQGKRRLHQTPTSREIAACRPWLENELRIIRPQAILCLGATAAHAVVGAGVRVLADRGTWQPTHFGASAFITVHPSSLLRQPDPAQKAADFAAFVADLKAAVRRD